MRKRLQKGLDKCLTKSAKLGADEAKLVLPLLSLEESLFKSVTHSDVQDQSETQIWEKSMEIPDLIFAPTMGDTKSEIIFPGTQDDQLASLYSPPNSQDHSRLLQKPLSQS